jgi:hydrophobe/amphiphile efflux-1 (HAE1) family protein
MSDQASPSTGGLAGLAIRRPVGTLALAAVVMVVGLFSLIRLPIDLLPAFDFPEVQITVNYPGVSAEVIEQQITRVLERNLADTENLQRISSRVSEGQSSTSLRFRIGTDVDIALQDTARGLEQARGQLPDVDPPRVRKFNSGRQSIWQGGFSSTVRNEAEVTDWIDNYLAPQLIGIPGVSAVESAGGMVREIEVILDPQRLHAYGLTADEVAGAVANENRDMAIGRVTSDHFDVSAKTDGLFTSLADIERTALPLPEGYAGASRHIELKDVAEVRDGSRRQRVFSRLNGTPATQVSIFKLPEANTVAVADAVGATLERLERAGFFPPDIHYQATRDSAFFIRGAISSVGMAALLGGALAMLMVLMFLGSLRKGLVIGLSIPLALMATFSLMASASLSLNIMSLGGLALGVGLLLDNAIVMLENISRHREQLGKDPATAAREGAAEVVSAITAGTLTNLAAVLPFLLVTGVASLVFQEMILTIGFAIIATLAAALTLVPSLAALLGRVSLSSRIGQSRLIGGFNRKVAHLGLRYRRIIPGVLRWRWAVIGAAAASFVAALWLFGELGNEFLPQMDDGSVHIFTRLPPGSPPEQTQAYARKVEALIREQEHILNVFTLAGGALWGGLVSEEAGTSIFVIQLTPAAERPDMPAGLWLSRAQQAVRELDLPGVRVFGMPPRIHSLRFTAQGNDFEIGITGPDLSVLQDLASDIALRLEDIPGLESVDGGSDSRSPLLRAHVDRRRAAESGLRVADVGRALRNAVEGQVPTRYIESNQEYDLRVRYPYAEISDAQTLGDLQLSAPGYPPVLLRDLVRFELGEGPARISRENQSRILRVTGELNTAVADVGSVMAEVDARLADLQVPDRYSLIYGGQWETIQETNRETNAMILLSIFLVFIVLAVQYERFSNPLVIMLAAPLALVGVSLMLWITDTPVSAPALIGLILLIGIVVNNAILLVEYMERGRRLEGLSIEEAIAQAGEVRLRPILMTTLTTLLGMLPLAIGLGDGGEMLRPLALTVVGGLSVSMLLTLFIVPCLYLVISSASQRLTDRLRGSA